MPGRECYHCKQWVEEGDAHNCWTTTEEALTRDLPVDLQEAYERIRETAVQFGEQRVYASLNSIMFSKKACYVFVRPKKSFLELVVFLGRALEAPQVKRAMPASKTKFANLMQIRHRDQVEAPITDWMREAYETSEALSSRSADAKPSPRRSRPAASASTRTSARTSAARKTTGRPTPGRGRAAPAAATRRRR